MEKRHLGPKYHSKDNFNISFTSDITEKKLKVTKCAGPDGFNPWRLNVISPSVNLPLNNICTKLYEDRRLPSDWKHAHIAPINKKAV